MAAALSFRSSNLAPHRRFHAITEPSSITVPTSHALAPHNRRSAQASAKLTEEGGIDAPSMSVPCHVNPPESSSVQPCESLPVVVKAASPPRRNREKWIKNSDLKSGRWMKKAGLDSHNSTGWANAAADDSWGGNPGIGIKDRGYSLMDYDGSWAPAPEDWDTRPVFGDDQGAELVNDWLKSIDRGPKLLNKAFIRDRRSANFHANITTSGGLIKKYHFAPTTDAEEMMGDIVPRVWIPKSIEALNDLQSFWQYHMSTSPTPLDDVDLIGVKPWWEAYPSPTAAFHLPLLQPAHKGIDVTDENPQQRRDRTQDAGSDAAVKRWRNRRAARRGAKRRSESSTRRPQEQHENEKTERFDSALAEEAVAESDPVDLSLIPKVNLYIRAAQTSDVAQITDLYNWYVTNSICVPECRNVSSLHMGDRLRNINSVRLPFLVACQHGSARKKGRGRGLAVPDKVIGIAYADDYNDFAGMYRFTAEVELYVHPDFLTKGVGKCLMDKLLGILDEGYFERGGYDMDDQLGLGAQRTLSKLIVHVPYNEQEGTKKWLGPWLESWGFEQKGDIDDIGIKLEKSMNLAIYAKKTGYTVNPLRPPVGMII
ncbi:hypothetical protein MBLNU459_g6695t1 [Dothideomycetes sp. NU459]